MRPARRYGVGPLRTSSLLGTSRFRKCQFMGMILSRFRRSEPRRDALGLGDHEFLGAGEGGDGEPELTRADWETQGSSAAVSISVAHRCHRSAVQPRRVVSRRYSSRLSRPKMTSVAWATD